MRVSLVDIAAVATTTGALAVCARIQPPWFALLWVALVPWLAALDRFPSSRRVLVLGWLQCVAFTMAVFAWFPPAIAAYTGTPPWAAFVLLAVGAPLLQPQFLSAALIRHVGARCGRVSAALAGASSYVATEWAWPKLFGDTLGHGLYASPLLRQAADVAGVGGLTLTVWLANECVLEAIARWRRDAPRYRVARALASAAIFPLALGAYGAAAYRRDAAQPAVRPVKAALVQADLSDYDRLRGEIGAYETVRTVLDTHFALSREALRAGTVDLLLWPETVYPTTFGSPKSEDGAAFDREIAEFVRRSRTPLVFGAYDSDGAREYNAAVFLEVEADGRITFDTYRKARPFPLTESVPRGLDTAWLRARIPWLGTWQPGPGATVMSVRLGDGRPLRVAPFVCLDAVDSALVVDAVRQGAQALVVLSNDGWFSRGNGPWLHLVVSAFRSIETRRPQLRVTNTGITAVIRTTGEIEETIGVHERGVSVAGIVPRSGPRTLVLAWGEWLGPAAIAVACAVLARALRRRPGA